jgi:DNA-binding transcriptional LysR family regulator
MKYNFDMDGLRTMVVGMELGNFSRAALHLGRSQSAISMQLKKLEEQAGKQLFVRKGRGLVPTEAGDALLDYARRIISLNDEAAVSIGATAVTTSVRMGFPQGFFEDVMPTAITQFSNQRPHVHVEVFAGRNFALEEEVRAGPMSPSPSSRAVPAGTANASPHCRCTGSVAADPTTRPTMVDTRSCSTTIRACSGRPRCRRWKRAAVAGGCL